MRRKKRGLKYEITDKIQETNDDDSDYERDLEMAQELNEDLEK